MEDKNLNEEILREQKAQEEKNRIVGNTISITVAMVVTAVVLFALYSVFIGTGSRRNSSVFTAEQLERL